MLSKKVLESETRTNGYLCGCCGRQWTEEDWISEEDMISFEEILNRAINIDPSSEYELTDLIYYDEAGEIIYGYSSFYGKDYCDVYIEFTNYEYVIKSNEKEIVTKEEVMKTYNEFIKTKGEDK